MLRQTVLALAGAAALAVGTYLGGATLLNSSGTVWGASGGSAKATPSVQAEAVAPLADLSRAFRTVDNAVKDAVVNIRVVGTRKAGALPQMHIPDELRKMLPPGMEPLIPQLPQGQGGGRIYGTGSGVIVTPDGYILTNNHVVENADKIVVRLDDGRELPAKIIGRDPKSDLAVVKIHANHLTYARFGDSDATQVGDWVLAFGSPFGFDKTMTQGIISAKHRQVNIIGAHNPALAGLTYEDFLQTDAAINPGNSGGPLVNLKGEVIGIDTAIASNNGAYNGVGFAIPSNEARTIMDSLIKNGKVVRGYLGVRISDLLDNATRKVARSFGYAGQTGVLVEDTTADSPGARGGLKRGDIITVVNGKPVENIMQLRTAVALTPPGSKITLNVYRDGKTEELTFPVGTQPESALDSVESQSSGAQATPGTFESKDLGITVADITPELATKLGLKDRHGVAITDVDPQGVAADAGLTRGEVIRSIYGSAVHNTAQFKTALARHKLAKGVRLSVRDPDGGERFVFLQKD
jgi:serine protease Do